MVTSCTVKNGMSDHSCVVTDINLKPCRPHKTKRKVYLRGASAKYIYGRIQKRNMESIKRELKQKFRNFKKSSEREHVEEACQKFKSILMSGIEKYIQKKIISPRWNAPWLTKALKRQIRRKQKLYNKAKESHDPTHSTMFKKKVKKALEDAHNNYLLGLLEGSDSEKNILSGNSFGLR